MSEADELAPDGEFVRDLAAIFPTVATLLLEHRARNYGDSYSSSFIEEVTRYAVRVMGDAPDFVTRLFEHFERTYVQLGAPRPETEGIRYLLAVAFIEELPEPEEIAPALYAALGPALRREYDEWWRWLQFGPFPHP